MTACRLDRGCGEDPCVCQPPAKPYPQPYTLLATFRADPVTAMEIKQAMEDAANALIRPTTELASVVFTRGAEAVVRAAQDDRE